MSPEARNAARKRMQEYWAKKKAQEADATPGTAVADQPAAEAPAHPRKARGGRRRAKKSR
jgi:hypothetical protein